MYGILRENYEIKSQNSKKKGQNYDTKKLKLYIDILDILNHNWDKKSHNELKSQNYDIKLYIIR